MEKINVLWVNNGRDELLSFLSDANEHGIEIRTCKSMKECRAHLINNNEERWDAVILNCDARLDMEFPKLDNFGQVVEQMKDFKRLSCFIVSETELDLLSKKMVACWASVRGDTQIYNLETSVSSLYKDIKDAVGKSSERFVREKYAGVYGFCNHPKLMEILIKYESGEVRRDDSIPNSCRDILEWLEKTELFKDYGLKYKDISTEIGKKLNVPPHVKRSFHFCVEVSNEGSHGLQTKKWIQDGAPYLNASLILNLLNVLHWCSTLDKNTFEL